jgi:D-serine deaminase-like pyridoxal phosphate-dependent protein
MDIREKLKLMGNYAGWDWITEPTLLLDTGIAKENIRRMAEKARRLDLRFRPHFKTHQSAAISEWFRAEGVEAITVSSIGMATYFADAGWKDILIAFPVNVRALDAVNALASRVDLGILISDARALPRLAAGLQHKVQAWIEIDTGDGRSGFPWDDAAAIASAAGAIETIPLLQFAGLMGHAGYTYKSHGVDAIQSAHDEDISRLVAAKGRLEAMGFSGFKVSTGDTPAASRVENYAGADEIRPGNFVFYDVQQQQIGSCGFEQIAVALACPVVAVYPQRGEVIIHGGGVHLGKDSIYNPAYGQTYGRIALPRDGGWEMPEMGCFLRSISQEHGVAVVRDDLIGQIQVGDLIGVLPVHSCMTADLMERLYPVDATDPRKPYLMMKAERK